MVDGRWSMVDGRWSMVDSRWSMVDGRWSMVDGRKLSRRMDAGCHAVMALVWMDSGTESLYRVIVSS